jgi:hypothetical protein
MLQQVKKKKRKVAWNHVDMPTCRPSLLDAEEKKDCGHSIQPCARNVPTCRDVICRHAGHIRAHVGDMYTSVKRTGWMWMASPSTAGAAGGRHRCRGRETGKATSPRRADDGDDDAK